MDLNKAYEVINNNVVTHKEAVSFMNDFKKFPKKFKEIKTGSDTDFSFTFKDKTNSYTVNMNNRGCSIIDRNNTAHDLSFYYFLYLLKDKKDQEYQEAILTIYNDKINDLIDSKYDTIMQEMNEKKINKR